MRIALDGAAVTDDPLQRFGTATYSLGLMQALAQYGTHQYRAYTFHHADAPRPLVTWRLPRPGYMQVASSIMELFSPSDVYLALNQAYPTTNARVFGFSHGMAALIHPQFYSPAEVARQKHQLNRLFKRCERIFVTSEDVKVQLHTFGYTACPIHVLLIGLAHLGKNGTSAKKPIILSVAMNHPIKQMDRLVALFMRIRRTHPAHFKDYTLRLVGPHTNYHDPQHNIICTGAARAAELAQLYQTAKIYVCCSRYESLHFPYLEALSANCWAVGMKGNVISELKEYVHEAPNESALAAHLLKLAISPESAATPRSFRQRFDWKKTVNYLESWY